MTAASAVFSLRVRLGREGLPMEYEKIQFHLASG